MARNGTEGAGRRHPTAIVETEAIGPETSIGAFVRILGGAEIGAGCEIGDQVFIDANVRIGERARIGCGARLLRGLRIEADAVVGPNAVFLEAGSDREMHFELRRRLPAGATRSETVVRAGARIGAGATLLPGIVIGQAAVVEVGAVVTHDVPPYAIVTGNPARIIGYVDSLRPRLPDDPIAHPPPPSRPGAKVRGVTLHQMPVITDLRGNLSVGEIDKELPFPPKRYFVVFEVSSREVRGEHAHRALEQFFVCLQGDCALVVDDGENREEFRLDSPAIGVHVAPMVWGIQYKFSSDAMLLVLASEKYDPDDYIRDYDEFRRLARQESPTCPT
ncbi:MAG: WxcM-like domain-containing protein [Blastocatellia bacterium]|nr:WxcM-like domain-containing protein [Blastocatellia bacterium]